MRQVRSSWLLFAVLVLAIGAALFVGSAQRGAMAANPPSGTVGSSGPGVAWDGSALGGSSAGESTCVEGVTCDTYVLNVSGVPTDWTGKVVDVRISWTIPANDFDLYIHKGSNAGPIVADSGSGAPGTDEEATFDPSVEGTGTYSVHVVYFSVAGEQYHGTAKAQSKPTARTATYLSGGITFSPNVTMKAPVSARDGEPSNRTDTSGNNYVVGIRGVPAGVDLWYDDLNSDPYMRNWVYRGQPDSFTGDQQASVGADGGWGRRSGRRTTGSHDRRQEQPADAGGQQPRTGQCLLLPLDRQGRHVRSECGLQLHGRSSDR